jgi:hypothetical protein
MDQPEARSQSPDLRAVNKVGGNPTRSYLGAIPTLASETLRHIPLKR